MKQTVETLRYLSEQIQWGRVEAASSGEDCELRLDIDDRPIARVHGLVPMRLEWYRHGRIRKPAPLIGNLAVVTFAWEEGKYDHHFRPFLVVKGEDEAMYALDDQDGRYMQEVAARIDEEWTD